VTRSATSRQIARKTSTIALDFRWLDRLNFGNGQYRYCVDLISSLAVLPLDFNFIVIGSQPSPPEPIRSIFQNGNWWRYVQLADWNIRGGQRTYPLRYRRLLRHHRVDLLHSLHSFLPPLSGARAVVTIYDMMFELFPEYQAAVDSKPYRAFKHAVQSTGPSIIAISEATANDVHRLWGIPRERISVVYLCAQSATEQDLSRSSSVAEIAAKPFLLSPYNLEPRKNLISLLRAMADVRRHHPDVRLVLFGRAAVTPEREERFRADVRELGLQDRLVMTGFISDEELSLLYRRAALFVFPSLYEGFGLPVLEAMAAGACTVVRNQSAMAEILADAGVQTETRDPALLSTAIRSLLDDPTRRADLGHAAERRSQHFTREAMARNTLALYMKALGREEQWLEATPVTQESDPSRLAGSDLIVVCKD